MENDKPAPRQSLLLVLRKEGDPPNIITQDYTDHGTAHEDAMDMAKKHVDDGVTVSVYRRIATYQAEIKVNHRLDGE